MEALVELLINKYGVPPDEAEAYAVQLTSGQSDTHGDALQGEALGNVASGEMERMYQLRQFPKSVMAAQTGVKDGVTAEDMANAIRMLDESKANTKANAKAAAEAARNEPKWLRTNEQGVPVPVVAPYSSEVIPVGASTAEQQRQIVERQGAALPVRPDPYQARLQKAMALRKAVLGH
jgi:hypothetical protein